MDAKRFIFFFLVSLVSVNVNATSTYRPNKILELTNRNWLTNNTTDFLTGLNHEQVKSLVSAPREYQELVKTIKDELAITQEIAVCEMDPIVANFLTSLFGFTPEITRRSGALMLNIEKLDQQSNAERKYAFYRELFKVQHNEFAVATLIGFAVWPLSAVISYRLLRNHWSFAARHGIITGFTAGALGAVIINLVARPHQKCLAHEADRFAAHALKCHHCLEEVIAAHEHWSAEERKGRDKWEIYVSTAELQSIAQELKEKNLVCDEHNQENSSEQAT